MTTPAPDPSKSCLGCPSYLQPSETVRYFKKSIGSPMCARYGIVLGRPGATQAQASKLASYYGGKCDAHGLSRPAVPEQYQLTVTLPDPTVLGEGESNDEEQRRVMTCSACKNYVRDEVVANELGWTAGLCAAKGRLLLANRLTFEARECDWRRPGAQRQTTGGMLLLKEYDEALGVSDPVRTYFATSGTFIDPTEYESDFTVTEDQAASGIRAWRKISDPEETGHYVRLPIYRRDYFAEDEQVKIPATGDDEHPELHIDHQGHVYGAAVAWLGLDETPALWGMPGTGKTELGRHMAWLMQIPFERISITGSTELEDLAGKMMYSKEKGTYFQEGRFVKAWGKPNVIMLDEPNTGMPDVWQFLRPLTDNSKQLVLDMADGKIVKRHDDCYLMLSMNPAWDPRNVGTGTIGDADARRLYHLEAELPPEALEQEIVRKRCSVDKYEIPQEKLVTLSKIAKDIRALCDDQTLPITWGVAQQIKVARLTKWFDWFTAYRRAIGDYLEPEAREALLGAVRAHVAS